MHKLAIFPSLYELFHASLWTERDQNEVRPWRLYWQKVKDDKIKWMPEMPGPIENLQNTFVKIRYLTLILFA